MDHELTQAIGRQVLTRHQDRRLVGDEHDGGKFRMRRILFIRSLAAVLAALAMIAHPTPASTQNWPARVVTLVVPFHPDGASTGTKIVNFQPVQCGMTSQSGV